MQFLRAQSEIGYLMVYVWAVVILTVSIGALYLTGVFNFNQYTPNTCTFPVDFSCSVSSLSSTGNIVLTLQQATAGAINVTAMGCNSNTSTRFINVYIPPTTVQIGGNITQTIQCYSGGSPYIAGIGTIFGGQITVNYTDINTGIPHTKIGKVIQKVTTR